MFLVDRETFQSDAIEGEPGEASTDQTIQTISNVGRELVHSSSLDPARKHTVPLTFTLVDSTDTNSVYIKDQCAVGSRHAGVVTPAENPAADVVNDQTEHEKDDDMGPVGKFTDLMSKDNPTDMGYFGDVVNDELK